MDKCILQHSTLPITITCEYTFEYHPGLPTNESSSIPTKIDGVLFANRFFLPKEDFNNEVKRDDFIVKCVHRGKKDDFFNSLPTKIKDKGIEDISRFYGVIDTPIAAILQSKHIPIDIREIWKSVFLNNNKPFYIKYGLPIKWYIKIPKERFTLLLYKPEIEQLLGTKYNSLFNDVYFDSEKNIYFIKPISTDFDEITIEEYLAVLNRSAIPVDKIETQSASFNPHHAFNHHHAFKTVSDIEQVYLRLEELEKRVNLLTNKNNQLLNTF